MKDKCNIICVTNRHLCKGDYKEKLIQIAKAHPYSIILREKDMSEADYMELATWFLPICRKEGTRLFLHSFYEVAKKLKPDGLHMPLKGLEEIISKSKSDINMDFQELGVSCHSVEDAKRAVLLGCTYIIAGHIYDTDCKKGLSGRGTVFLKNVTEAISLPVYAIGGITPENKNKVLLSGAEGVCIMSSVMENENVELFNLINNL